MPGLSLVPHRLVRLGQLPRIIIRDGRDILSLLRDPARSRTYYPAAERKSKAAILKDLVGWWLRSREVNEFYYLYGLDRRGAAADGVMPYSEFRAIRNARNLHPDRQSAYYGRSYNFVCLLRDKAIFSQFAASLGVPVPRIIAECSTRGLRWTDDGREAPLDHLVGPTAPHLNAVCKPADGIMGAGLFLLRTDGGRLFLDDVEASVDDLRARLDGRYLIQERIVQHPQLARLHPASINTVRLVTFNQGGEVTLFSAALRMGARGRSTDNWAGGGVLAAIDRERGTLRGPGYMKPAFGRIVERHPDTEVLLDGLEIPYFQAAVETVRSLHAHLPGIHSVGWDIAIGESGPLVIEGNDDWDGAIPMVLEPRFRQRFTAMYLPQGQQAAG